MKTIILFLTLLSLYYTATSIVHDRIGLITVNPDGTKEILYGSLKKEKEREIEEYGKEKEYFQYDEKNKDTDEDADAEIEPLEWCAENCEWCCCEGSNREEECWECEERGCYEVYWDCACKQQGPPPPPTPTNSHTFNTTCIVNVFNNCTCSGIVQSNTVDLAGIDARKR